MKVVDIARAINPTAESEIIGIRPGEKLHEQMIGVEDSHHTFEYGGYYKIMPAIDSNGNKQRVKNGQKVPAGFIYTSDKNTEWMSVETLRAWVEAHYAKLAKI
jgi:UDP-N-acetylglucosamine 4,6-dehydratase